jgi:hypothetical protein
VTGPRLSPTPRPVPVKVAAKIVDAKVLEFVKRDPGATARDVARELFGGTGDPRTSMRCRADKSLRRMHIAGKLRREPESLPRGSTLAYRWFVVDA